MITREQIVDIIEDNQKYTNGKEKSVTEILTLIEREQYQALVDAMQPFLQPPSIPKTSLPYDREEPKVIIAYKTILSDKEKENIREEFKKNPTILEGDPEVIVYESAN